MAEPKIDLIGKRFGKLVVQSFAYSKNGAYWNCACDCGGSKVQNTSKLNSGGTVSCGCSLRTSRDRFKNERFKHGMTDNPLFAVWSDMIRRCYGKKRADYKNYGGRGITVCDRWLENFKFFVEDMVARPDGKTLERIDTNKGYSKENCEWVTRAEQNRNSRHSKKWYINGIIFESAALAGEYFGVCHATITRWCQKNKPGCFAELKYQE